MAENKKKELQVSPKQEVESAAEQTQPGRVFVPAVDIFETDEALTVLADMPGVTPADLNIDLRENVLTLTGRVQSEEAEETTPLLREYDTGSYYRQFRLSNAIDQTKIDASLTDGVLRLVLPKAEAARPRKIEVRTG